MTKRRYPHPLYMKEERTSVDRNIIKKLRERQELLIKNSTKNSIPFSPMLWAMELCVLGNYPFARKEWMTDEYMQPLISEKDYNSGKYDMVLNQLMKETMKRLKKLDTE